MSKASLHNGDKLDAEFSNAAIDNGINDAQRGFQDDYLGSVTEISKFLGWTARKVRYARETGALPIRVKTGVGLYAFKSELLAALKTPDTLGPRLPHKAHGTGRTG
jgi:hypothetical protein